MTRDGRGPGRTGGARASERRAHHAASRLRPLLLVALALAGAAFACPALAGPEPGGAGATPAEAVAPVLPAPEQPAPPPAGAPPRVTHRAPGSATRGTEVPVMVRVEEPFPGDGSLPPVRSYRVTLSYLAEGTSAIHSLQLSRRPSGEYSGNIPPGSTRGSSVLYMLRVQAADGSFQLDLGTPARPLSIPLLEITAPPLSWGPVLRLIATACVSVFALALTLILLERRRIRALHVRRFWTRTLHPLLPLSGRKLAAELAHLAEVEHDIPFEGRRKVSRAALAKHLHEVRTTSELVERTFWIETLSPLLNLEGRWLAGEIAKASRQTLKNPVEGGRQYPQEVLLHRLEDVRSADIPDLCRGRNEFVVPGFDERFLREATRARERQEMDARQPPRAGAATARHSPGPPAAGSPPLAAAR